MKAKPAMLVVALLSGLMSITSVAKDKDKEKDKDYKANGSNNVVTVPEPSTTALLVTGLVVGVLVAARRRRPKV